MANFTHVFSPTTTNEFVFTLARYINPSTLSNPSAVDRFKTGSRQITFALKYYF